jgi:DNA repair protein RAD50
MANEKEVKAQVRLRFWNVNRQRMTATRNLQVTVKKGGGLTMKTLEGILAKTDVDGGEGKVSSSTLSARIELTGSEIQYRRNVQRWMKKFLSSLECQEPS